MRSQPLDKLNKLKQDIIAHERLISVLYKETYVGNSLARAIEKAQYNKDFMASMASSCKEILNHMDKKTSTVINKKLFMLCKAIADQEILLKKWPDISSFHELIGALQKRNFLEFKKEEERNKRIPQVLTFTLADLCKQIENVSAATSLNDVLRKDSLFLKVRGFEENEGRNNKIEDYNGAALEQWLSDHEIREELRLFDPKIIVGDIKSIDYSNEEDFRIVNLEQHDKLITYRHDYLTVGHVCCRKKIDKLIDSVTQTLTSTDNNNEVRYQHIFDMDMPKKMKMVYSTFKKEERLFKLQNDKILNALYDLKDSYKKNWRWTHRDDIRDLILEVKSFLDKEDLRNKLCFDEIIAAIRRAYNKEKEDYIKNSFTFFPRIENFEERLQVNDNRYCYPRGLKAILDLYSREQKVAEQQKKDYPSTKKHSI